MNFASPFFVVPMIVAIFFVAIRFAIGTKEDGHSAH